MSKQDWLCDCNFTLTKHFPCEQSFTLWAAPWCPTEIIHTDDESEDSVNWVNTLNINTQGS